MAAEMPDIEVGHVVTPTADSELGAKGAGEAGLCDECGERRAATASRRADHADADYAPARARGVAESQLGSVN
jgi:hypothetical protein